jgi:predicted amidohydrolase
MKIAAIQHEICWEDREATFRRLRPLVAGAAGAGARLAVLSEMFSVGFSMDTARIAEPVDGPSAAFLVEQARQHGMWLYGSAPERLPGAERPRNVGLLVAPDGSITRYAKLHPFTFAREHESYDAGTETVTIEVEGLRVSLFVCYDLRFADDFWMLAPQTDCYLVCANWPETRRLHWQSLLVARAIENQAYVVGVNRVGEGGGLRYAGDSRIVDPLGELLATGAGTEALLVADVSPEVVADVRHRFRFLPDRRTYPLTLDAAH